jgi:hypothetical protein
MAWRRRDFLTGLVAGSAALAPGFRWPRAESAEPASALPRLPTVAEIRSHRPEFWKLVDAINALRKPHGLPAIPLSPRLTAVAYWHAKDLAERRPQETYGSLHSWSVDPRWHGGAYRADDKSTWTIMWDKPKEIAGYGASGFEISAAEARDCEHALELWTQSQAHHQVILNQGVWADPRWRWRALGAVFHKGYACAWFGNAPDA